MDKMLPFHFHFIFLLFVAFFVPMLALAQDNRILGKWVNEEQNIVIEMYKEGNNYCGKIAWLQQGNQVADSNNSTSDLRNRQLQGVKMLANFMYSNASHVWENGTLYDYRNGRTYSCQMWFENEQCNNLYIRSYVGLPLLGTTTTWTRPTEKHPVYGRSTSAGK
jgi:uncharacterized protein (DUF2147 family)